jgi:hypothetical protein
MTEKDKNKWILTLYITILFLVISSPITYRITSKLTMGLTADDKGCPTAFGVLIHTLLFLLLTGLILSTK